MQYPLFWVDYNYEDKSEKRRKLHHSKPRLLIIAHQGRRFSCIILVLSIQVDDYGRRLDECRPTKGRRADGDAGGMNPIFMFADAKKHWSEYRELLCLSLKSHFHSLH